MSISDHKHMPEPVRRIEVFTGAGRRRNWSAEEKASIIAESYVEGETESSVARRHGLTAQQLFTWRRQARQPAAVPGDAVRAGGGGSSRAGSTGGRARSPGPPPIEDERHRA